MSERDIDSVIASLNAEAMTRDVVVAQLREMADANGEIAYTSNTRSLLDFAEMQGCVKAVSGKFREVEAGHLNSIYRLLD